MAVYIYINRKFIFKAQYDPGTLDMSISKHSRGSAAGCNCGHKYEVLRSHAWKISFRMHKGG